MYSYSSQESAETDKYIGVFAKLRVIERVAYNFKTLVPITKKLQFHSKYLKIQAILPTHGLVSLTKFHNAKAKNVDFLLVL